MSSGVAAGGVGHGYPAVRGPRSPRCGGEKWWCDWGRRKKGSRVGKSKKAAERVCRGICCSQAGCLHCVGFKKKQTWFGYCFPLLGLSAFSLSFPHILGCEEFENGKLPDVFPNDLTFTSRCFPKVICLQYQKATPIHVISRCALNHLSAVAGKIDVGRVGVERARSRIFIH